MHMYVHTYIQYEQGIIKTDHYCFHFYDRCFSYKRCYYFYRYIFLYSYYLRDDRKFCYHLNHSYDQYFNYCISYYLFFSINVHAKTYICYCYCCFCNTHLLYCTSKKNETILLGAFHNLFLNSQTCLDGWDFEFPDLPRSRRRERGAS